MNWEQISKLGTANLAILLLGYIMWEQTQAMKELAGALVELVRIYSGGN